MILVNACVLQLLAIAVTTHFFLYVYLDIKIMIFAKHVCMCVLCLGVFTKDLYHHWERVSMYWALVLIIF